MCALISLNKTIINIILHMSMHSMWVTNELIATTYTDLGIDLVGALTLPWLDEVLYDLPEWAFLVGPNLLLQVLLVDNREVRFLRPPFNVRVVHEGAHRTLGVVNGLGLGSGGRRHRDFTGTGEASEWGDMAGVEFIDLHAWPIPVHLSTSAPVKAIAQYRFSKTARVALRGCPVGRRQSDSLMYWF